MHRSPCPFLYDSPKTGLTSERGSVTDACNYNRNGKRSRVCQTILHANIYNYVIHHSNKQNIRVRMWMYKTHELPLFPFHSLSLPFLFFSLTRLICAQAYFSQDISASRFFFTPYKLELTLEVLELHPVISVSGIQCSRNQLTEITRCVGDVSNLKFVRIRTHSN